MGGCWSQGSAVAARTGGGRPRETRRRGRPAVSGNRARTRRVAAAWEADCRARRVRYLDRRRATESVRGSRGRGRDTARARDRGGGTCVPDPKPVTRIVRAAHGSWRYDATDMKPGRRSAGAWAKGALLVALALLPLTWAAHAHSASQDEVRGPCDLCALACHAPALSLGAVTSPTAAPRPTFLEIVPVRFPEETAAPAPFGRAPPAA